jgi:soluble lytic murein transglycosylase
MHRAIRPVLAVLALSAVLVPPASAQDPMAAVRSDHWSDAEAAARQYADPLALKLVTYYRLLAPGAAGTSEIADFMTRNPDWPNQALLERRRQEALAAEPDDATVLAACDRGTVKLPAALLRCAYALANAGRNADAAADARQAWITGFAEQGADSGFPQRWAGVLTADGQWARFQALAWSNAAAAQRQIAKLDPPHRAIAETRLALQHDDPAAFAKLTALPASARDDPGLVLDAARWLRHADRTAEAAALWRSAGAAAERAAPDDRLAGFWVERNQLARRLLRDRDAANAYAVVDAPGRIAPEQALDAEFLAGFIALRFQHDPATATRHFQTLAGLSKAALTQSRAQYWLGRAAAAAGQDPHPAYQAAAAWPTTFYGQLAALALGDDASALAARIAAVHDPAWTHDQVVAFTDREVVRAAAMLTAWGEARRAHAFILRMDDLAPDPGDRSLTARFALGLGMPDMSVFVARRMGRDGLMLPDAGWPIPFEPPAAPPDPAVTLGLIRQESNFDVAAVSPSGARGLMQLMPATAEAVAKQLSQPIQLAALTVDPALNMRLGTSYIQTQLDRFGGTLPFAVAAYNAGPARVDQWLAENGDPRAGPIDMLDWIELIPINETRNYVQRVLENVVIYRARRGETTPTLVAEWTR